MESIEFFYEFSHFIALLVLVPMFFLLAFLPYIISRHLYRNISEKWFIPSKIISIMTAVLYSGIIIHYFIQSIGIMFTAILMVHIVMFVLIVRSFFRKKTPCGNYYGFILKFLSVILNIIFGITAFLGVKQGLSLVSAEDFLRYKENFSLWKCITGMIISEVSVFMPCGMNLLLDRRLYNKNGLSKWWTFPAVLVSMGIFLIYWHGLGYYNYSF
ncbi:MAG: hypothetical protein NC177_01940 [Ruminococcus flavefaciens]|nr:hypothetical protein [Ruminococcus flavefaciens]